MYKGKFEALHVIGKLILPAVLPRLLVPTIDVCVLHEFCAHREISNGFVVTFMFGFTDFWLHFASREPFSLSGVDWEFFLDGPLDVIWFTGLVHDFSFSLAATNARRELICFGSGWPASTEPLTGVLKKKLFSLNSLFGPN